MKPDWPNIITRTFGAIDSRLERKWGNSPYWVLFSDNRMSFAEMGMLAHSISLKGSYQELTNLDLILKAARLAYTDLLPFYGTKGADLVEDAFETYCFAIRGEDEFDTGVFQIHKSSDAHEIRLHLLDNVLGKKLGTHSCLCDGHAHASYIPSAAQDFIATHTPWLILRYYGYFDPVRLQARHPEVAATYHTLQALYDAHSVRVTAWMATRLRPEIKTADVTLPGFDG